MYDIKFQKKKILFFVLKIRTEIIKVLIDFYQRIPTAKYYEVGSFNYIHGKKENLFLKE
jgi:hypothetical protein